MLRRALAILAALALITGCAGESPSPAPPPTHSEIAGPQPDGPVEIVNALAEGTTWRYRFTMTTKLTDISATRNGEPLPKDDIDSIASEFPTIRIEGTLTMKVTETASDGTQTVVSTGVFDITGVDGVRGATLKQRSSVSPDGQPTLKASQVVVDGDGEQAAVFRQQFENSIPIANQVGNTFAGRSFSVGETQTFESTVRSPQLPQAEFVSETRATFHGFDADGNNVFTTAVESEPVVLESDETGQSGVTLTTQNTGTGESVFRQDGTALDVWGSNATSMRFVGDVQDAEFLIGMDFEMHLTAPAR